MVRFKVTVKITLLRLEIALSLEKCCDLHMDHSFMEKIAVVLYVDLFLYALSDISDTIVVPQTCSVFLCVSGSCSYSSRFTAHSSCLL